MGLFCIGIILVECILSFYFDMVSGGEFNVFFMVLLEVGGKLLVVGLDGLDSILINVLNDVGMVKLFSCYL